MMGLALERFFSRLPRYLRRHYLIAGQAGTVAIGRRVWQFWILCFVFMLPMQALSSPTSSGPSIFKREIIEIVKRGDYEEVERLLSKLQKMFDADETNESDVNRAFNAFANSDPTLNLRLDEWIGRKPESSFALTARGIYNWHLGWITRGERTVSRTHPKRFAAMKQFFAVAKRDLTAALRLNNKIAKAYTTLMSIEMTVGQRPEFIRLYRVGVAALPRSSSLHFALSQGLEPRWGGSETSMDAFFMLAETKGKDNTGYQAFAESRDFYMAQRAYSKGRYSTALALNDSVLRTRDAARVRGQRGLILWRLNREEEALREFQRGIKLDPEYGRIRIQLAEILVSRKRYGDALAHLNEALRLDPYNPSWLASRSDVLLKLNRVKDAERDLDDALVFGRYEAKVHARRGRLFSAHLHDQSRAADAYRRARDLAPHWTPYWRAYAESLYALRNCEYLPVSAKYLEMCVKSGKCGEGQVRTIVRLGRGLKNQNQCPQKVTAALLLSRFSMDSNVRGMELSGLKLGASVDDVRRRFPRIKIEQKDHPIGPGVVYTHEARYRSEDGSLDLRATLSRDGRLLMVATNRVFALEESLEQIKARLIQQYGKPDRVHLGDELLIEYKQSDAKDRILARLQISVKIVRLPVEVCRLPRHLRNGRTVARIQAQLYDLARSAENTKITIGEIRVVKVDAAQALAAAQARKTREQMARQATAAIGC